MKTNNKTVLSKKQKEQIIELYCQNISPTKIGEMFNIKRDSVTRIAKKAGINTTPKKKLSDQDVENICKLYVDGLSTQKLADKFKVSATIISKYLKRNNIKIRDMSECHRIYPINEDFFDVIDTEEKAYFLGFLYADGCNHLKENFVTLGVQHSDKEILKKLAALIYKENPDNQIKISDRTHDNKGITAYFTINSKHICHRLDQLGCVQSKTFKIKYPNWLSNDLHRHFIRGYFDGDGGSTIFYIPGVGGKIKLTSTKDFVNGARKVILDQVGISLGVYKYSSVYDLASSGDVNSIKFLHFMYDKANIFMRRKHDLYLDFVNKLKFTNYLANKGTQGYSKSNIKKSQHIKNIAFDWIFEKDEFKLTKHNIKLLSSEEREELSIWVFKELRKHNWKYPDDLQNVKTQFDKLTDYQPDLTKQKINGSNLGNYICKVFCHSFYKSKSKYGKSIIEVFEDDELLMKVVRNRLGLDWKKEPEFFDISFKNIIIGMRSSGAASHITMFKPTIAKYIVEKYSNIGDTVYDYSAGFGGRMLGACSAQRKYIGTDPLTHKELKRMRDFLKLQNCTILGDPSETVRLNKNSIDLAWSSPPYFDIEIYSEDSAQAYNNGIEYFINTYWEQTLRNVKYMLKSGGFFGLNVKNQAEMIDMSIDIFGEPIDEIEITYSTSHFNKTKCKSEEPILIFKNQ
jgi:predicted DNA-binding protein YlxM (UPF0122 family)